jgi:hypothetical protein
MNLLSIEQLEKLTTPRLLAYKKKLMQVPEEPNWDECSGSRMNKIDAAWKKAYADVKSVLSKRENVEKKK